MAAAFLLAASPLALADESYRDAGAITFYADAADRPQLVRGYRSSLGLRLPDTASAALGGGSSTSRLLARYARTGDTAEPMVYAIERAPVGTGLRGTERATGLMLRGAESWSTAFEAATSTDAFTAARRTVLSGQFYAPLVGGVGLTLGMNYSAWQSPTLGNGGDFVAGPGYSLVPGRIEAGAGQIGYQLQLNYLYGERNLVALTYNSRREGDQFRLAPDPLNPDSRQLSLTGEHWFSPSWAVRYDIPAADSGNLNRRQGLRLGVHYRF